MSGAPAQPVMVLVGPTAAGKTALTLELCRRFGAEVVSADSVQVYRGLDLGSAKPTPQEIAQAPHHLIDVADPSEEMDAARWAAQADQAIEELRARGKRVLVAGGTGLYVKALLWGLAPLPPPDPEIRRALLEQWESQGPEAMHQRLAEADPQAAGRIHPNDRQRVVRALEVWQQTAKPLSQWQAEHAAAGPRHAHFMVGLERPLEVLGRRIAVRAREMWAAGLVEEVRGLLDRGVPRTAHALNSLGYRQALAVIRGDMPEDEALAEMIRATRAYAKRQLTWFRAQDGIHWHAADDAAGVLALAASHWAGTDRRENQR